jgi:hypothetical protein
LRQAHNKQQLIDDNGKILWKSQGVAKKTNIAAVKKII